MVPQFNFVTCSHGPGARRHREPQTAETFFGALATSALVVAAVLVAAACAQVPDDQDGDLIRHSQAGNELSDFLTSAHDGDAVLIAGRAGQYNVVTAGPKYAAASGQTCRSYYTRASVDNTDTSRERIACLSGNSWRPVRPVVVSANY